MIWGTGHYLSPEEEGSGDFGCRSTWSLPDPPQKSSDLTNIQAMKNDWSVTSNVRIKRKKIKLIL